MARAALRLALATGSLAVAAAFAGLWAVSGMVMHPPWHVHRTPEQGLLPRDGDAWALENWQGIYRDPGADFGYAFEDVEFPTEDTTVDTEGMPPALLEWIGALAAWRLGGDDPAPIDVVGRIAPRPLLLMHGSADRVIPAEHSRRLLARSGQPSELWLAPGAGHAALINRHPDEYRKRVLGFLARSIGAPGA